MLKPSLRGAKAPKQSSLLVSDSGFLRGAHAPELAPSRGLPPPSPAAMLAALILHTFQVVSLGIAIRPCFHAFSRRTTLNLYAFPMPNIAIHGHRVPSSMPGGAKNRHSSGTQIRVASFDSRIIYPKQENSHAIQACYLGPRGRLTVRSDGDRVGTDAAGSRRVERRQRRTWRHRYQNEIWQNNEVRQDENQQDEVWHNHRNGPLSQGR